MGELRVIVEAGHGPGPQDDPGAVGPNGITEREVVGTLAHHVAACSGAGVIYLLKRRYSKLLGGLLRLLLYLRMKKFDVLISLHCDSGSATRTDGAVYYWTLDPDQERAEASYTLACELAQRLTAATGWHFSVRAAPYMTPQGPKTPGILRHTAQKAVVLIEHGFISNPACERAYLLPAWHVKVAGAEDAAVKKWAT